MDVASSPSRSSRSCLPRPAAAQPRRSGPASPMTRGPVHVRTARSRSTSSPARARAARRRCAPPLERDAHRHRDADGDGATRRADRDDGRGQRRLLHVRDRSAERRADAGRAGPEPAVRTSRSSAGVTTDGTLDVRRIAFFGTWQGVAARSDARGIQPGARLRTASRSSPGVGAGHARGRPAPRPSFSSRFPPRFPNADLGAPVVEVRTGGAPGADPARRRGARRPRHRGRGPAGGGAGRTARDDAAPLQARLAGCRLGDRRRARRSCATARRSSGRTRLFTTEPARAAGAADAPSASSRTVASSSSRSTAASPGLVGMTNFELAQTLVRLGAVTGMALDGGGSTTMAFDGALLNRPSDGRSGRSRRALVVPVHRRLRAAAPLPSSRRTATASPTAQSLALQGRSPVDRHGDADGAGRDRRLTETGRAPPGRYGVAVPAAAARRRRPADGGRRDRSAADGPWTGRWKLAVVRDRRHRPAVRDDAVVRRQHDARVPRRRRRREALPAAARARSPITLEADAGRARRRHGRDAHGRGRAHACAAPLRGRRPRRRLERPRPAAARPSRAASYVVRVVAKNALGTIELAHDLRVQRIVGP